ncbi:hypothetical protein DMA12_18720 [Amycolatopsis balhimycina DSM 5908]|uniref:DUF2269 domain-containing protein n=1 Tax=Amycolatopsis balhimycina DSM 5908 TaxID=1081091 RepID=A0A428WKK4_AMYBA|nr:hypothetical protein [Amycolatopsis balhimycina]RSM43621.1 hypothetical protein DMA12_18720 [Amycolatopsis balhimycina DSM 5908]
MTRLSSRARKAYLLVHIVSGGLWFGIDAAFGILVCTALIAGDPAVVATSLRAVGLFVVWPMLTTAVLTLGTGVVLGLGTKYGLVRYWWVAVKLAANVLMVLLIFFSLRPGIDDVAEYGRQLAAGGTPLGDPSGLLPPVVVAPSLLLLSNVLSVFKPWGRVRRGQPAPVR